MDIFLILTKLITLLVIMRAYIVDNFTNINRLTNKLTNRKKLLKSVNSIKLNPFTTSSSINIFNSDGLLFSIIQNINDELLKWHDILSYRNLSIYPVNLINSLKSFGSNKSNQLIKLDESVRSNSKKLILNVSTPVELSQLHNNNESNSDSYSDSKNDSNVIKIIDTKTTQNTNQCTECYNLDKNTCLCNQDCKLSVKNCISNGPKYASLIFSDDFKNFLQKVNLGIWFNITFPDPIDPIGNPPVIADDGKIIQECDGVILDSSIYTKDLPHPLTPYNFELCRNIINSPNMNYKGVCVEFTVSQNTKGGNKVYNTVFGDYYENTGINPNEDFRLANSSISVIDFTDDSPFAQITFTRKKIYFVYGIFSNLTNTRDMFFAAAPIVNRKGKISEKFTFSICVNFDGSVSVYYKDNKTCEYKCVLYVNNLGVPPTDKKFIKATYSRDAETTSIGNPHFFSQPVTINSLFVCVGNLKYMNVMDPLSSTLPTTVLYDVATNIDPIPDFFEDDVYRYTCECNNELVRADSVLTLPGPTPTTALNFGQGSVLKLYNINASYIA